MHIWQKLKTYWRHCDVSVKTKLQVHDAVIRSKLIYGLDSVRMTDGVRNQLDAFQLKGLPCAALSSGLCSSRPVRGEPAPATVLTLPPPLHVPSPPFHSPPTPLPLSTSFPDSSPHSRLACTADSRVFSLASDQWTIGLRRPAKFSVSLFHSGYGRATDDLCGDGTT
jgi:hypothetical protein